MQAPQSNTASEDHRKAASFFASLTVPSPETSVTGTEFSTALAFRSGKDSSFRTGVPSTVQRSGPAAKLSGEGSAGRSKPVMAVKDGGGFSASSGRATAPIAPFHFNKDPQTLLRSESRPAAMPQERGSEPKQERNKEKIAAVDSAAVAAGAAGLAHDASNLLAALKLYSELLAFPGVLSERHRHYADDLKLLADRSSSLIERLVAFGSVTHARAVAPQEAASIVDVLMKNRGLLSTLSGGKLEVTFGSQAALPIQIAPEPMERILINLVKNATQATKEGGSVRIRVGLQEGGRPKLVARVGNQMQRRPQGGPQKSTGTMVLTVDDSGCGMTEDQVREILEAGTPAPGQQHGIGLRVVRELVAVSGGKLKIQSQVGVGTRVEIQWPSFVAGAEATGIERTETVAASREKTTERKVLNCFTDDAEFDGALTDAERRLLNRATTKHGKKDAGAIAC